MYIYFLQKYFLFLLSNKKRHSIKLRQIRIKRGSQTSVVHLLSIQTFTYAI